MNRAEKRRQQKLDKKKNRRSGSSNTQNGQPWHAPSQAIQEALDIGTGHHNVGDLDKAEAVYKKILEDEPGQPVALHLLGVISSQKGNHDLAVELISKAVVHMPNYAEAHGNLGNALRQLGRLEEAATHFQKVIEIDPQFVEAHSYLGNLLRELGRPEEAIPHYQAVIDNNSNNFEAYFNLGNAYGEAGIMDEAIVRYQRAIEIEPNYDEAYGNLGCSFMNIRKFSKAKDAFDQMLQINHGGPWPDKPNFAEIDKIKAPQTAGPIRTSTFKLRDSIDQLNYLMSNNRLDSSFQEMADRYLAVLDEIQDAEGTNAVANFSSGQWDRLGSFYNRVIHLADAPRINTGTINASLNFKEIEDGYLSSPTSVTTFDDFLTPESLRSLRDFCLESTIFFNAPGPAFVGSDLRRGFNCDLLFQIVDEVRDYFPRVIGDHELCNIWTYRYLNQSEGVGAHTDEGAVTFNFWITPDEANLEPDTSGLIVYAKEQPDDWDWNKYNAEKYSANVGHEISDFLADAKIVKIPYRENRAVLFHSNLFHKSGGVQFRDGFESRRMNVTLLFGKREL